MKILLIGVNAQYIYTNLAIRALRAAAAPIDGAEIVLQELCTCSRWSSDT